MWNDTYFTHDPECFQGDRIMVWAAVVVWVVEGRVGARGFENLKIAPGVPIFF